nr:reverse transcriptase domain-containing protein [Tanacetum cinerariifolium]
MSVMANTTPIVTTVTKTATKEKTPNGAETTSRINILDFYEEHYEDILPVMDKIYRDKKVQILDHLRNNDRNVFGRLGNRRESAFKRLSDTYSPSTTKSGPDRKYSKDDSHSRSRPHKRNSSPSRDRPRSRGRSHDIEELYADHLSRIENDESNNDSEVDDNFLGETLMEINTKDEPWFADFANYLVADIIPKGMTYQQKNKFFSDLKHYFWEETYLFKSNAHVSHHETEQAPSNNDLILELESELVLVPNTILQPEATRKYTRVPVQPSWLKDYVTPHYLNTNQVSLNSQQNQFHAFICALVAQTTPTYFKEAVKDADWCKAMDDELRALEENDT